MAALLSGFWEEIWFHVCWDAPLRSSRSGLCFFKFLSRLSLLSYSCFCLCASTSVTTDFLQRLFDIFFVASHNHFLSCGFFFLVLSRSLSCAVRLGGVSSRQSYPSAQYESGLQQGGQQGEQQGHQPRTLLHTSGWVAVVARCPRGVREKWVTAS